MALFNSFHTSGAKGPARDLRGVAMTVQVVHSDENGATWFAHTHTRWSEKILYHEKFELHAPKLVNLSGSNWHQVGHTWTLGRVLAVAKHVSGDTSGLFTASHQQRQSKSSPKPLSEMHTHKAVWKGSWKCNVRSTKATEKANTQRTANWPDIKQRTVGVSGDIQTHRTTQIREQWYALRSNNRMLKRS